MYTYENEMMMDQTGQLILGLRIIIWESSKITVRLPNLPIFVGYNIFSEISFCEDYNFPTQGW